MKKLIFYFLGLVLLFSCSSNNGNDSTKNDTASEEQRNEKDLSSSNDNGSSNAVKGIRKPDFIQKEIDPTTDQVITFESGTSIRIPANSFKDKQGNLLQGKVTIAFREYHTAGEILASGESMVWDSSGTKVNFESAGMFEIKAYYGEEEVDLAENKKVKVELASKHPGAFHFFRFERGQNNWNILARDQRERPNTNRSSKLKEIAAKIKALINPIAPTTAMDQGKYFNLDINPQQFPEYEELNEFVWETHNINGSERISENFRPDGTWELLAIETKPINGKLAYLFKFKSRNKKSDMTSIHAFPIKSGKRLKKDDPQSQKAMADYAKKLAELNEIQKQYQRQAEFLRTMELDKMGLYNYDRQIKSEENIQLAASFAIPGLEPNKAGLQVYLIPEKENAVIRYDYYTFSMFAFNPKIKNKILALLPNGELAAFLPKDFSAIDLSNLKRGDKYTFDLRKLPETANDAESLDEAIASL